MSLQQSMYNFVEVIAHFGFSISFAAYYWTVQLHISPSSCVHSKTVLHGISHLYQLMRIITQAPGLISEPQKRLTDWRCTGLEIVTGISEKETEKDPHGLSLTERWYSLGRKSLQLWTFLYNGDRRSSFQHKLRNEFNQKIKSNEHHHCFRTTNRSTALNFSADREEQLNKTRMTIRSCLQIWRYSNIRNSLRSFTTSYDHQKNLSVLYK